MSVKEEIKEEEEFDDFLQEYLSAIQKGEEKPGLEHDCKTETERSPTLACKEEKSLLMGIKKEDESDLREYGCDDSSPTSKLQIIFLSWETKENTHHSLLCVIYIDNTWILVNGFNLCFIQ